MIKQFCFVMAALLTSMGIYAQGQVNFITVLGPAGSRTVDAPVSMMDGTPPSPIYTVQLFLANGADPGSWIGLTPTTVFRSDTPAASYYVVDPGTPVTVPGYPPQSTAPLVMRAWENAYNTYEAAVAAGAFCGQSPIANITLGGGTLPPTNLIGLQGFTMVPEPSTIAFGLLGACALLLRHRRK
jgi:hypothetical protein